MCRSELDRVRQQVAQHLAQSRRISDPDFGQPFRQVQTQGELLGFGLRAEHPDRTAGQVAQRELDRIESHLTGFEPLIVEHVVHQREEVIGRVLHGLNQRPLLAAHVLTTQQLRSGQQGIHRRADLVVEVGNEATLQPVGLDRVVASGLQFLSQTRAPAKGIPGGQREQASNQHRRHRTLKQRHFEVGRCPAGHFSDIQPSDQGNGRRGHRQRQLQTSQHQQRRKDNDPGNGGRAQPAVHRDRHRQRQPGDDGDCLYPGLWATEADGHAVAQGQRTQGDTVYQCERQPAALKVGQRVEQRGDRGQPECQTQQAPHQLELSVDGRFGQRHRLHGTPNLRSEG